MPPLIESGRGVELPGEIRGNELKVTRARRDILLSLSLSFSFLSCRHHPRVPTELLTTTPSISPLCDSRVVNYHARHQYHRNQHAFFVAIQITKKNREKKNRRKKNLPFFTVWFVHAHCVPKISYVEETDVARARARAWILIVD